MSPEAAWILSHGMEVSPGDLEEALVDAISRYKQLLYPRGASGLPASEAALLQQGGFDLASHSRGKADPLARSAAEYAAILKTALTVAEAAVRLGVTEGRIRQRLAQRSLYGVDVGRGWRLPLFQFTEEGELPGWAQVAPHLPEDLSPVELMAWCTLDHPDLVCGPEEVPTSPRDWLLAGRPAAAVAELASMMA